MTALAGTIGCHRRFSCGKDVGEHDELADDGGDRDLVRLAAVGQPLVEDAHVGVGTAGDNASHVEHLERAGPPAADMASAA